MLRRVRSSQHTLFPVFFQMEKLGQRCSISHANYLGHSFTLFPFSLALSKKNLDLKYRERDLHPSPSGQFHNCYFTLDLEQQSNCQKVELIHLFHLSPNKLSCLVSLKTHPEQDTRNVMRHSPTTAAIHIFNLFAEGLDLYSLFPHTLLLTLGLVSAPVP